MKGLRFTIKRKIILGFSGLILVFIGFGGYTLFTNYQNIELINKSLYEVNPSNELASEFTLLVNRSKMLITNWVYLQTNSEDKEALEQLHDVEYKNLKNDLIDLFKVVEDSVQKSEMDTIIIKFEELLEIEKGIMNELVKFDDYEDPIKKFMAEETISEEVLPRSAELINRLEAYREKITAEKTATDIDMQNKLKQLSYSAIILLIIISVIGFVIAFLIIRAIIKPLGNLQTVVDKMGEGDIVRVDDSTLTNDEIGDMSRSVDNMAKGYSEIAEFAENIGQGKYESDFTPLSDKDVLGNALIEMRNNLKKVADEDKKRNWATSGMAKFGDILRNYSNDYEKLSDEIISNLVKYIDANQGALFIIDENEESEQGEPLMEMTACYAWNKKKFINKKIHKGEGLSGQAWLEADTIYITDIPDDYVRITSGLGSANPKSILIVPLKVNDEIYGVIEIASFEEIEKHKIEFIEQLSESIASTISNVKINARTQKLLKESTMMTEQMRAQEEEMRQNMEELQATQEKIQRDQNDREAREKILMDSSMLFELTPNFNIIKASTAVKRILGIDPDQLEGKAFKDYLVSPSVLNEISNTATTERSWSGILEMNNKNGRTIKVWGSGGQVQDSIHDNLIYVVYLADISQLN